MKNAALSAVSAGTLRVIGVPADTWLGAVAVQVWGTPPDTVPTVRLAMTHVSYNREAHVRELCLQVVRAAIADVWQLHIRTPLIDNASSDNPMARGRQV